MRQKVLAAALMCALITPGGAVSAEPTVELTVVELFTSQGCALCPAADRLLGELAARDDVLALGFHVTYWDYIGWTDAFGLPEATMRHRAYGRGVGRYSIVTPEVYVDGQRSVQGWRREGVLALVAGAPANRAPRIPVDMGRDPDGRIRVSVGPPPAALDWQGAVPIFLVAYDRLHTTTVTKGANQGQVARDANVVRVFRRVGEYSGGTQTLLLEWPSAGDGGIAIILQSEDLGAIMAVGHINAGPP